MSGWMWMIVSIPFWILAITQKQISYVAIAIAFILLDFV